jgi:hypothetical protein
VRNKKVWKVILITIIPLFLCVSCEYIEKLTEHEIVAEQNAYLRGSTYWAGFMNLMDNPQWANYKSVIQEITQIKVEYRVTRNGSPSDISINFYFGESSPDTLMGNALLTQGETHSELQTLTLDNSYYQLIDLIMRKDAFWYSIQGNTDQADVDFEPVRVTINGTFNLN